MAEDEKKTVNKLGDLIHGIFFEKTPEYLLEAKESNLQNQPLEISNNNLNMAEIIAPTNITETDAHYEEQIRKAIREADQPGPDFLELSDAVKKLKSLNQTMDTNSAIQNAFIVLSSGGLTKSRILETGQDYLEVLKLQRKNFESAILKGSQIKIDAPQSEIEEIKKSNEDLEKQKRELDIKIETNKRLIDSKQQEVNLAKEKLSVNKAKFNNTITMIESEMSDLISQVQKMNL